MKIFFIIFIVCFTNINPVSPQTVSEKEIFELNYKGTVDSYNFDYDEASGNYCYIYRLPDENKSFIISKNSVSDKYDYVVSEDIKFDSKGNYYAVTSDYKPEYGSDNYFLISNGKVLKSYDYIESYSSYINKKDEFVFVFKELNLYKIGYFNPVSGFRQSDSFDNIRTAFNYTESMNQMEGDAESYDDEDFYHNENGERAFIATSNGKTKIIFETSEIETEYSDINESSLTKNKNNELSFIAKKGGRFYELTGNEFVVSGNKEYDGFDLANIPLLFTDSNEPVYIAGDSISEDRTNYFVVIGNQIQKNYLDESKSMPAPDFTYIMNLSLNNKGSLTYTGAYDIIIPGREKEPGVEVYDKYYSRSFFVKNGVAYELGYNINRIKYNDGLKMLYSGLADLEKKEQLLMMNYGESKIIINRKKFDDIFEYGFTPLKEIYYIGQTYEDTLLKKDSESSLYLGDELIGKADYFTYQTAGDSASVLKFDSKNNYVFAAEKKIDSLISEDYIVTKKGRLPFPQNVSGSKMFSYIYNLMFTKDDKLFFVADMTSDPVTYEVTKELFVDNRTLGKKYNTIDDLEYDEDENEISFIGSRGNKIYSVTIDLKK